VDTVTISASCSFTSRCFANVFTVWCLANAVVHPSWRTGAPSCRQLAGEFASQPYIGVHLHEREFDPFYPGFANFRTNESTENERSRLLLIKSWTRCSGSVRLVWSCSRVISSPTMTIVTGLSRSILNTFWKAIRMTIQNHKYHSHPLVLVSNAMSNIRFVLNSWIPNGFSK
jgi:hypothetical protein